MLLGFYLIYSVTDVLQLDGVSVSMIQQILSHLMIIIKKEHKYEPYC